MNSTDKFIEVIYGLSISNFPETVIHQAKRCLMDYMGATLAGAKMLEKKGIKLLSYLEDFQGNTTVIGLNRKAGIQSSSFVNGLSAHIAELDDGVISGIVHPGAPIFSALLPIAEKENIDGTKFIAGVIIGYEVTVRIAEAIQPSHKKLGYHATATCGTIGVAVGVAVMLGFNKNQLKDAFSAAVVSAFGTLKVLENGSELKPFNVARASQSGILAALMARAGFSGPDDVLSGYSGFFSMVTDELKLTKLEKNIDDPFGIERVFFKPYAACRYCHPSIDAALNLRSMNEFDHLDIERVNISTYYWAVKNHDHTDIPGVSSAKMSIPYSFAVAMISGKADIIEFTEERINDAEISALTQKIIVSSDDEFTSLFPEKSIAVVEIITHDGQHFKERVDFPKGEPENPLTDKEIEEKFIYLARFANKETNQIQEMVRIIWNVENEIEALFSQMA